VETQIFNVLGVMSGTSLDGVDLACVRFEKNKSWSYEVQQCSTVAYPEFWQKALAELTALSPQQLQALDVKYTAYLGDVITAFCAQHALGQELVVCSHGHTALHQPEKGITYQLGNLPELAEYTARTVVCDFRTQDVALGGQGAPLVPVGDVVLFEAYAACLNLGGFANVSIKAKEGIKAYDIAAVNTVLNTYAQQLGFAYDNQGAIARSGKLLPEVLKQLNAIAFYEKAPPKSLGVEWNATVLQPLLKEFSNHPIPDILHTYIHHIALQIGAALPSNGKVLVTGGGAFNTFLMECIQQHTKAEIVLPSEKLIAFKEAIVFGFLGVLKLLDLPNCLAQVTGAPHDHVSGQIFHPSK
jgi:anhydro-N-acetylmuramic acid kinase